MTISSETRKAGPFNGNGVGIDFPFEFKVFSKNDISVVLTSVAGVDSTLVLDSDYSVTLNSDQDASPGGSVRYPISGTPLAIGQKLTVVGDLAALQPTDITNLGGFYPAVIEDALDRLTILVQQTFEKLGRTLKFAVSDTATGSELPTQTARANSVLAFDANGNLTTSLTDAANVIAAQAAADRAEAAAASTNLPSIIGKALNFIRVKSDASGYETRTAAQVRGDISAVGTSGNETIGGTKTFSTRPIVGTAAASTNDAGAASTAYADSAATAALATAKAYSDDLNKAWIYIREEWPPGTNSGTFTAGGWRTRRLTTKTSDAKNIATLNANQIILPAGTYRFSAVGACNTVNRNRMRLQNITDGITVAAGISAINGVDSGTADTSTGAATVKGRFTIAATKTFELQHYCQTTVVTNGFGYSGDAASGGNNEVFSEIEFIKEA